MEKRWTVMVYMAADNHTNEGFFADLEPEAVDDLREMQSVGSNDDLNVIVQVDWKTKDPERLQVWPGELEQLASSDVEINTGSAGELQDFVDWAQRRFPASNYLLILWGHSLRYAFGFDHADALTVSELRTALPTARARQVDILGFDACGMSTVEGAYEFRNRARYLLASEIGMPLPGWPYARVLSAITDSPEIQVEELGQAIVDGFVAEYPDRTVALTLLNLASLDADGFVPAFERVARALAVAVGSDPNQRELILRLFTDARVPTGEPLVDLRELCVNLGQATVDNEVQQAAGAMLALLANGGNFIVDHKGNGDETSELCGVGAYAPHVGIVQDSWLAIYDQLDLSDETYWSDLVKFLAVAD